jgi:hypothetical protein
MNAMLNRIAFGYTIFSALVSFDILEVYTTCNVDSIVLAMSTLTAINTFSINQTEQNLITQCTYCNNSLS